MKVTIVGKNFRTYDKLEETIEKKFDKLGKYFSDDIAANVILSHEKGKNKLEATINAKGAVFRTEQRADDIYEAVDKSIVNVIGTELCKLPVNRFLDLFHIGRPSVLSGCVVGAEMNLIDHVLSVRFKCFAIVGKTSGRSGRQIDIVDSIFIRHLKGF